MHWTERCPHLLRQWHPTKNEGINPKSCKVKDKVWWYLPYDDPETEKHFEFEWPATVISRSQGNGCPFLSGRAVWAGFNDLATKRPDLAAQWHPSLNGDRTPESVTCGSGDEVWWYLPYEDPETGEHFDFEWPAIVSNRSKGSDCPFLSGRAVWPGYNDLASKCPSIAKEWHPLKNRKKTTDQIFIRETTPKRWWLCLECGHVWRASEYAHIVEGVVCPNCRKRIIE